MSKLEVNFSTHIVKSVNLQKWVSRSQENAVTRYLGTLALKRFLKKTVPKSTYLCVCTNPGHYDQIPKLKAMTWLRGWIEIPLEKSKHQIRADFLPIAVCYCIVRKRILTKSFVLFLWKICIFVVLTFFLCRTFLWLGC